MLNLLYILCCLPIFTIGAATTALYTVTLKMAEDKDSQIFTTFLSAFKLNFKYGTILWLLFVLLCGFLTVEIYITSFITYGIADYIQMVLKTIGVYLIMLYSFIFPYHAKFDATLKQLIQNTNRILVNHLGWTVVLSFANSILVLAFFLNFRIFLVLVIAYIFIGFAGIAFLNSFVLNKVFGYYLKEE